MSKKPEAQEATIDNFLYNIPVGFKLEIQGFKKRGRGRPSRKVAATGHTLHIESTKPDSKILTPKQRFEILAYYRKLQTLNPNALPKQIIAEVAKDFELTYKQIQLLCL